MNGFDTELNNTLDVLKKGGAIVYPSDTVWGLGCDATMSEAIDRVSAIKGNRGNKSFILLLDDSAKLHRYVKQVPEVAWDLLENAVDPLTIVYPGAIHLPGNCIAEDGTIAIRIVNDPFCRTLIKKLNHPLVSTSANLSGKPAPSAFTEIDKEILAAADYVVNLRRNENCSAKPSSILQLGLHGEIRIIRK